MSEQDVAAERIRLLRENAKHIGVPIATEHDIYWVCDKLTAAQSQITHLENVNQRLVAFSADNTRELRQLITKIYDGIHRGVGPMSEASDMEIASEIHETMCGLFGNEWREKS